MYHVANVNIIFETTKKSRILIDAAFLIINVLTDRNLSNIYKILQIIWLYICLICNDLYYFSQSDYLSVQST